MLPCVKQTTITAVTTVALDETIFIPTRRAIKEMLTIAAELKKISTQKGPEAYGMSVAGICVKDRVNSTMLYINSLLATSAVKLNIHTANIFDSMIFCLLIG